MKKLVIGSKIGGVLLFLLVLLLPVSLSADEIEEELTLILSDFDKVLTSLEKNYEAQEKQLNFLSEKTTNLITKQGSLEKSYEKQNEHINSLSNTIQNLETISQSLEPSVEDLNQFYRNTKNEIKSLQRMNDILIGVSITALGVGAIGIAIASF